jgi:hypothetical protein
MSPTNFGDLATNKPFPNGAMQVKRGVKDTYTNYTSAVAAGTVFPDGGGTGGLMQLTVTPIVPCFWLTTAESLWWSPDAIWSRGDFGLRLSPADLDGRSAMARCAVAVNSAVPWRRYATSMMWRLSANIVYTVSMTWEYSSGYNQQFSTSPLWYQIYGLLLGENVV